MYSFMWNPSVNQINRKVVIAIETSCDDTSLALVAYDGDSFEVVEMHQATQEDIHQHFGGVVPELAYRSHATQLLVLLKKIGIERLRRVCDGIAVTGFPGLPGSLLVWRSCAHFLSHILEKPIIEVHHIMWHVFSLLCDRSRDVLQVPYVCLTVSGGHNDLYYVDYLWSTPTKEDLAVLLGEVDTTWWSMHTKMGHIWRGEAYRVWPFEVIKLWQTLDDAAGEAFDKVARMLWGPYPGGARIGQMALWGKDITHPLAEDIFRDTHKQLPRFCVSFSGLKSQLVYALDQHPTLVHDEQRVARVAYLFQERVVTLLSALLVDAYETLQPHTLAVCGGVAANHRLRERVSELVPDPFFPISIQYCTDNAWMIGVAWILDLFCSS